LPSKEVKSGPVPFDEALSMFVDDLIEHQLIKKVYNAYDHKYYDLRLELMVVVADMPQVTALPLLLLYQVICLVDTPFLAC
jgi:hypothetical protein